MQKFIKKAIHAALLKRLLMVVACLFFLNGCTTKLAYHFLDWGIFWYIERYVELDKSQTAYAKQQLSEFHHWHRTTQLEQYADYLETLIPKLNARQLTGQAMHDEIDALQVYLDASITKLTPMFIELAATLSDEQVEELKRNLKKEREKFRKDFIDISDEKLHKNRTQDLRDHLKLAISGFSKQQKAEMLAWSKSLKPFEALTLKQQEIWAEELGAALAERQQREQLAATIRKLLFVHTDHWNEELEQRMDYNQDLSYAMLANLLNNLTPKQNEKMNTKLNRYIQDFRELAKTAEAEQ